MKKLLLIPTALFPYAVSLFLFCFFKSKTGASVTLPYLIVSCVVCACLALACNVVFLLLSREDSAERLCKTALILKAIHIPAYVAIFVLGLILGLMFFMTFPIIFLLIFLDCVTLFFSGMISVFALIKNRKNGTALTVIAIICQFYFCADVISLFVLQIIASKRKKFCV